MASPNLISNYNGDVLDYIITEAVTGNEAVQKGSVYVIPDVPNKISIAKMVSSAMDLKLVGLCYLARTSVRFDFAPALIPHLQMLFGC